MRLRRRTVMHRAQSMRSDRVSAAHDKDRTATVRTLERHSKKGGAGAGDAVEETEKKLAAIVDTHKARVSDIVREQTKVGAWVCGRISVGWGGGVAVERGARGS